MLAGVVTLAVLSTGFTSLAISTAFDRRYAVTKRLVGAGVPRGGLLAGKSAAVGCVVAGQIVVLGAIGVVLGWRPAATAPWALPVVVLGAVVFTGLGLLLGGTAQGRARARAGQPAVDRAGCVRRRRRPADHRTGLAAVVGEATPAGALSAALHAVLTDGSTPSSGSLLVLLAWGVAGWAATLQWFKWQ